MNNPQPKSSSLSTPAYLFTFLALGILLLLTILAAHLGSLGTLISFTIAACKALLVAVFFMHLRLSSKSTWIFATAGLLWLAILFAFIASDYLSRSNSFTPPNVMPASNVRAH